MRAWKHKNCIGLSSRFSFAFLLIQSNFWVTYWRTNLGNEWKKTKKHIVPSCSRIDSPKKGEPELIGLSDWRFRTSSRGLLRQKREETTLNTCFLCQGIALIDSRSHLHPIHQTVFPLVRSKKRLRIECSGGAAGKTRKKSPVVSSFRVLPNLVAQVNSKIRQSNNTSHQNRAACRQSSCY